MLVRYPDWANRLHRFLTDQSTARFRYGQRDCCLFVADAVLAMTGTDIAASYRNQYASRKEALDLLRQRHGSTSLLPLMEATAAEHGLQQIPPPWAQRGNIVLVRRSRDYSLGILALTGKEILAASKEGFLRLPLTRAACAWRV